MRIVVCLFGMPVMSGSAFRYGDTVFDSLTRVFVEPRRKASREPSGSTEDGFTMFTQNTGEAGKFLLGQEKREEESGLRKLLRQRRRDTRPFSRFEHN